MLLGAVSLDSPALFNATNAAAASAAGDTGARFVYANLAAAPDAILTGMHHSSRTLRAEFCLECLRQRQLRARVPGMVHTTIPGGPLGGGSGTKDDGLLNA